MADNPYVSAASGAAQGASSAYNAGLQFATALRAEAAKQQQQRQVQEQVAAKEKQATLKDQFETELKMRKDYTPYGQPRPLPENSQGQPTLMQGDGPDVAPSGHQADVDPRDLITDPWGRQWLKKPDKPEATAQQGYTDLQKALESGARTVFPRIQVGEDGSETPTGRYGPNVPDQSRVMQVPGTGQSIYQPTSDEKAATTLDQQLRAEAAKRDAAPPKPEKPDATSFIPGVTGPGGGPVLFNKNDQSTSEVTLPAGSKRELTPGQAEVKARAVERDQDRHEAREARAETTRQAAQDRTDKAVEIMQAKHDDAKEKAGEQRTLADQYGSKIGVANGEPFIDPADKTGTRQIMDKLARTRMAEAHMRAKGKADDFEKKAADYAKSIASRRGQSEGAAAPAAAAKAAPAQRIRVQIGNKTGMIDAGDFDAKTMKRLGN